MIDDIIVDLGYLKLNVFLKDFWTARFVISAVILSFLLIGTFTLFYMLFNAIFPLVLLMLIIRIIIEISFKNQGRYFHSPPCQIYKYHSADWSHACLSHAEKYEI